MRRFQHLTYANDFPDNDVRPFRQYVNDFDYDRWTAETKLKPCAVRWTLETNDRVKWGSDTERDKWFDGLTGETYELSSAMNRIVTGENVKLPIPWQALQFANFLEVQVPDMPDDAKLLDYSTPHVSRIYYFIVDAKYVSPSVSECVLVRDNWTTYINGIDIPRIEMERGHQAMTGATPAQYLTSPINNLTGLTEKEPDAPADPTKVTMSEFHPLGTGEMWLMMAVKCEYAQLPGLDKAGAKTDSVGAVYTDHPAEWGVEYDVEDYTYIWGGESDVTNLTTPLTTLATGGGSHPTGMTTIAIPTGKAQEFVNLLNWTYPQVWNMLAAAWVLPRTMFDVWSDPLKLEGVEVWHVRPIFEKSLADLNLNTDDFAYNDEYAKITKLYTAPYAWLAVTNGDTNETANIRIEDTTGDLKISERVNLAYPYLKSQTFLDGIGGNQTTTYEWRTFDGGASSTTIGASAWHELATHEIPTFSLYVESSHLWNLDNAGSMKQLARDNAIRNYHMSQRATNVAQINGKASAETALKNTTTSATTALANATAGADTGQANANRSADTALSNATASANTALGNATASANTALSNATASADTGLANVQANSAATQTNAANQRSNATDSNDNANTLLDNNTNTQNKNVTNVRGANNYKLTNDAESDSDYARESFWANQSATFSSAVSSQAVAAATTTIAVGATLATGGAAAPIAAAAIAGTGVANVAMSGYSAQVSQTKNESQLNASLNNIEDKRYNAALINSNMETIAHTTNNETRDNQKTFNAKSVELSNSLNEKITNTNTATANANAARTRNTTVSNATASKNTAVSNATATRDTAISTATATRDTTKTNAQAARDTSVDNAKRTKDTAISTATASRDTTVTNINRNRDSSTFTNQTHMDMAQAAWDAKIKDLQRSKATEITTPTGDAVPDMFGVRGIQVRVMTQNDDITRRCGDDMLRYGYTWHANIENPDLNVKKDFTYWQGSPQLIPIHAPAQAVNDINELFHEGVTVWRNPDRIGSSIYENLEA